MVWIKFAVCASIIFLAGSRLTKYADVMAERTGLCRAWIGIVLLATVTSLPELANGISAAAVARLPDLAAGDLLGACMVNMFTLALLDIALWVLGRESIFVKPRPSNILSALFGIGLLLFTALVLAAARFIFDFSLFGISIYAFLILLIYLAAQRILYTYSQAEAPAGGGSHAQISDFQVYFYFAVSALIVIAAGSWLPFIGGEIVAAMGWGKTFVAVLFLGLATTLPEMTVSFSALRLGEVGMSVGNLVGSNVFNIAIFFAVDLFYQPGSLFSAVSFNMVYAALFGALLLGVVYFSLKKQVGNRIPSISIILIYLFALYFIFRAGIVS